MARWRRSLAEGFWALDRALGGRLPPTRLQKWVARHPVGAGLCAGVPFALFLLALSPEDEPYDVVFAILFGLAMSVVFGLTALAERFRQRRLARPETGNGS
ncbi:hypothetical protein ACFVT5_31750 [Streptomyces sp. NPDC058001]|uniref:hypothetical protein n=1 Tax=Streptomyces sp. NPDC058001 TaxID=3346300 RepID=UPI0036E38C4C